MLERKRIIFLTFLLIAVTVTKAQEPRLVIYPTAKEHSLALGKSQLFTCRGEVPSPEQVSDLKWTAPDGRPITEGERVYAEKMPADSSVALFIQELREEDAGTYTCEAVYANSQKLRATMKISTFMAITWEDAPTEQFPRINEEYKVKCKVKGNPSPIVDWLRKGDILTTSDRLVVVADGLLIKNVTLEDEGVYTCRAGVVETGELQERNINVEIHIPPQLQGTLPMIEAVEGDSASVTCKASGKPTPTYTWVNRRGEDAATLDRFSVDSRKGIMMISRVERGDHDEYRCIASNAAGTAEGRTELVVVIKPHIEELKNITVRENSEEAKLLCRVSGRPLPQVTFHKLSLPSAFTPGTQGTDDRIYVEQQEDEGFAIGELIIRNTLRSDDGLYACIARNKGGDASLNGHITVEFKPSFANTPMKDAWSWKLNPVNITCLAESIPNATITWQLQGRDIKDDPNLEQIGRSGISVLRVTPVEQRYYGVYTCKASNPLGDAEHPIQLKEARVPGEILQAKMDTITATTITFSFIGPSDNGGLPIKAYAVLYKEERQSWDSAGKLVWPVDVPYILENLEPQKTFQFQFAARNDVGFGPFGANEMHTMPKRSAPEEPYIFSVGVSGVVNSPYTERFTLEWQMPADNGERIDKFEINYFQVKNSTEGWTKIGKAELVEIAHPGPKSYELQGLQSDTYYKVELRAHNNIGFSVPAEVIVKTARDPSKTGIVSGGSVGAGASLRISAGGGHGSQTPNEIGLSSGAIVGIVVAALFIVLVIVDVSCYFVNKTGLLMLLCNKASRKKTRESTAINSAEKEPLKASNGEPNLEDVKQVSPILEKGKEFKDSQPIGVKKQYKDSAV